MKGAGRGFIRQGNRAAPPLTVHPLHVLHRCCCLLWSQNLLNDGVAHYCLCRMVPHWAHWSVLGVYSLGNVHGCNKCLLPLPLPQLVTRVRGLQCSLPLESWRSTSTCSVETLIFLWPGKETAQRHSSPNKWLAWESLCQAFTAKARSAQDVARGRGALPAFKVHLHAHLTCSNTWL